MLFSDPTMRPSASSRTQPIGQVPRARPERVVLEEPAPIGIGQAVREEGGLQPVDLRVVGEPGRAQVRWRRDGMRTPKTSVDVHGARRTAAGTSRPRRPRFSRHTSVRLGELQLREAAQQRLEGDLRPQAAPAARRSRSDRPIRTPDAGCRAGRSRAGRDRESAPGRGCRRPSRQSPPALLDLLAAELDVVAAQFGRCAGSGFRSAAAPRPPRE